MLAERRRGGDDLRGVFLELVRDADALHLAVDAVGPGGDVVAGGVLRALFDVRGAEGLLVRDAGLVHDGFDLIDGALGAELRDGRLDALAARQGLERARHALGEVGVRAVARRGQADERIALFRVAGADHADEDGAAVLAVVEREACRDVADVAGAVLDRLARAGVALVEPLSRVAAQQAEHRLILRHVACVALAGDARVGHDGQRADAGVVGGGVVGQVRVDLQRGRRGARAVHVHVAAHGLAGDVVGRLVLVRSGLAVAGDVDDGELAVDLPHMLVAQAVFGIGTGAAGLDPDVRPCDQLFEHLFALGGAGVERDGVRVAVILRVAVVAAGLAGHVRGLDLHDLRAHLCHDARGEGACDVRARHEHLHARQDAELRELAERHMRAVIIFIMRRHSYVSFLSALRGSGYMLSQPASTFSSAPEM